MNQELKDAIMDAVYTPLERDDMQTPCALPFMTSSEHGVCDGDGCHVSDESIASALNAVAKIQTEYYKVKKETQKETKKETQKEMTNEPSPRPWHIGESICGTRSCIHDANGEHIASCFGMPTEADAALIVKAVNLHEYLVEHNRLNVEKVCELFEERDRLLDIVRRLVDSLQGIMDAAEGRGEGVLDSALLREARAAIGEEVTQ